MLHFGTLYSANNQYRSYKWSRPGNLHVIYVSDPDDIPFLNFLVL